MKNNTLLTIFALIAVAAIIVYGNQNWGWFKNIGTRTQTGNGGNTATSSDDADVVECVYRSQNGTTVTIKGNRNDAEFMKKCKELKGTEPHTFSGYPGTTFYPYYTYSPYYYYSYPYYSYYYPYYGNRWRHYSYYPYTTVTV